MSDQDIVVPRGLNWDEAVALQKPEPEPEPEPEPTPAPKPALKEKAKE